MYICYNQAKLVYKKTKMKHLIPKEHHPHLKRRAILELLGLLALVIFIISEWEFIDSSLFAIRNGDLFYLLLAFVLFWLLLPLTAISYRLLCQKKIPLFSTVLAHLAGSGPGRIIPGGLGPISIGVMHLNKVGVPTQKAVVVSLSNNVTGILINIAVFMFVVFYRPEINNSLFDSISSSTYIFFAFLVIGLVVLCFWLYHFRSIRNSVIKVEKQFFKQFKFLKRHPKRIISLFLIAFIILIGNVLILQLSGDALRISISPADAVVALSIGVLIGGLLPTPGGLGGVEAGIAASLSLLGFGAQEATSVALLYRTVTYWQPLLPGVIAYLYLRERRLI